MPCNIFREVKKVCRSLFSDVKPMWGKKNNFLASHIVVAVPPVAAGEPVLLVSRYVQFFFYAKEIPH